MPFVNKQKCKKCRLYTESFLKRYWCSCDKRCKIYTKKQENRK